jgi:large subunit ribosomal protein L10
MPPRIRLPASQLRPVRTQTQYVCWQCGHASLATATTPAPPIEQTIPAVPPALRYPPTQPPSHKPPEFRKSQLQRQYQSVLRSSPLIVLFQHNNIKATEWAGIRRELAAALREVDEDLAKNGDNSYVGTGMKLQIVQTGIFASALNIVQNWNPDNQPELTTTHPTDPRTASSASIENSKPDARDPAFKHGLSRAAWRAARRPRRVRHGLEPLLSGPIALLTCPEVSPRHLKAALSVLSPSPPNFPAPRRRASPGYFEKPVQDGLQKLMLLGARVERRAFDMEGVRWVGGIAGGLTGLRSQLVAMLSGVGAGVTNTLDAASRSLYFTVESRRTMLEDEQKEKSGEAAPEKPEA